MFKRLNKWLFLLVFSLFGLAFTPKVYADSVCTIKVNSPNGGETWKVGETHTITWETSSNVDKVAIGYSFGPGSLNWIAFSTPNTKSYSWTVNIGNTTNTQVKIDITGYETGKGSCIDQSDGFFTVNGANPLPSPSPRSNPTYTPPPASNPLPGRTYVSPSPSSKSQFVKTDEEVKPTPAPRPISITSVVLWQEFTFEDSRTTNLKDIDDPAHVKDFTLDTKEGWMFVFTEEINLTDPKVLKAVQDIKDYWVIDIWFIWIKIEWWEIVQKPVEVTFKNEQLTSFTPQLVVTDNAKETKVEVKETKPGEVKAALTGGGGKVIVKPKVELLGDKQIKTSHFNYVLKGKTSHKDLDYQLKINGQKQEVKLENFNSETGEFDLKVSNLVKGNNFVQLNFKQKGEEEWHLGDEKNIIVESPWINILKYIIIVISILILIAGLVFLGIFLEKKFCLATKILKIFKKRE